MLGQFSFGSGGLTHRVPSLPRTGPGLLPGAAVTRRSLARAAVRLMRRYPWRCLCLGSEQMTMTRPCRRMIRHLLQIFFTLGLTFIAVSL